MNGRAACWEIPSLALALHFFARTLRECDACHETREDARTRRLPDGDQPVLCGDCFRDAASRWERADEC